MMQLRAYECGVKGTEWTRVINATSRGKAKAELFQGVRADGIDWNDVTCRVVGPPVSSLCLKRCAEYRKFPVVAGSVVRCGDSEGWVVDGTLSATFSVLFFSGAYSGQRLSVHPGEMEIVTC